MKTFFDVKTDCDNKIAPVLTALDIGGLMFVFSIIFQVYALLDGSLIAIISSGVMSLIFFVTIIPGIMYSRLSRSVRLLEIIYKFPVNDFTNITKSLEKIHHEIFIIYGIMFRYKILYDSTFIELCHNLCTLSLFALKKTNSELIVKIEQQKDIVLKAVSQLSENITGKKEFDKNLELQRARLDRQIEQFEELQRVLVKV